MIHQLHGKSDLVQGNGDMVVYLYRREEASKEKVTARVNPYSDLRKKAQGGNRTHDLFFTKEV